LRQHIRSLTVAARQRRAISTPDLATEFERR
jgi:hypothetical protein